MTTWVVECGVESFGEKFVTFREEFQTELEADKFADNEHLFGSWDFVRVEEAVE